MGSGSFPLWNLIYTSAILSISRILIFLVLHKFWAFFYARAFVLDTVSLSNKYVWIFSYKFILLSWQFLLFPFLLKLIQSNI